MNMKKKRKHLTFTEINALLHAAEQSQMPERNACMVLLIFYHGLRVSEARNLLISDLSIDEKTLYVRRSKNSFSTNQPLVDEEIHFIKAWLAVRAKMTTIGGSIYLFPNRDGRPFSRQRIYTLIKSLGESAKLTIGVYPHMLRHACGYSLADKGADTRVLQDYLGHKNIRHTVLYTASNTMRFKGLWQKKG